MLSLTQLTHTELHWRQPHLFKMDYELRHGEEILARLHFPSSFKTIAIAQCADGSWTFERTGFIHHKVLVASLGSDAPLAVLERKTNRLETATGLRYPLRINFWQTEYTLETEAGQPLLCMMSKGVVNLALEVQVFPAAIALPAPSSLPWMILLGWYLVVMAHNDAAATAATTAASSAAVAVL